MRREPRRLLPRLPRLVHRRGGALVRTRRRRLRRLRRREPLRCLTTRRRRGGGVVLCLLLGEAARELCRALRRVHLRQLRVDLRQLAAEESTVEGVSLPDALGSDQARLKSPRVRLLLDELGLRGEQRGLRRLPSDRLRPR